MSAKPLISLCEIARPKQTVRRSNEQRHLPVSPHTYPLKAGSKNKRSQHRQVALSSNFRRTRSRLQKHRPTRRENFRLYTLWVSLHYTVSKTPPPLYFE